MFFVPFHSSLSDTALQGVVTANIVPLTVMAMKFSKRYKDAEKECLDALTHSDTRLNDNQRYQMQ
jgi:hypothetical protein